MLFDLRGAGRQRMVKVVYVLLAFLIGGGLVFFGIGNSGIGGGLFDAFSNAKGGSDPAFTRLRDEERALTRKVTLDPKDAAGYAQLALVRTRLANQGANFDPTRRAYTQKGLDELRQAASAWERYLALNPAKPDDQVARVMVLAYAYLGNRSQLVLAQEIVANDANTPAQYAQLAYAAYAANQTRKGDLAAQKALSLTPKDMRQSLKGQLDQAKQQAIKQSILPSPSATP